MECMGPRCAAMILEWMKSQSGVEAPPDRGGVPRPAQGLLFGASPYVDEAATIRDDAELEGALEHLEYAVFRRFENQLTRAERSRLDNSIRNAMFKVERYLARDDERAAGATSRRWEAIRERVEEGRLRVDRIRAQARRADLKLAQLTSLTPEGFEEFVAELFEALEYEVDRVGGTGDEGADLRVRRDGLLGVVQCKYHKKSVVGSPDLQKFLGTVHHTRCHKGFFVTTSTFSLSAEKFAAEHPIELIDGPRLVELVREALGPAGRSEPGWF